MNKTFTQKDRRQTARPVEQSGFGTGAVMIVFVIGIVMMICGAVLWFS